MTRVKLKVTVYIKDFSHFTVMPCDVRLRHHFGRGFALFIFCHVFVFVLCLVHPMLPVSLHCPFMIAPSLFYEGIFFIYTFSHVALTDITFIIFLFSDVKHKMKLEEVELSTVYSFFSLLC